MNIPSLGLAQVVLAVSARGSRDERPGQLIWKDELVTPATLRRRTYTTTRNMASPHLHTNGHVVCWPFILPPLLSISPFTTVLDLSHVIERRPTTSTFCRRRATQLHEQPRIHGDCDFQSHPVFP